jgi:L-cysteine:1D-myo-inositol 2-amino-2-deoxy-alpha-D-glucopyranoside ligase
VRLYNTMTRQLDDFFPGPLVSLYVCGVTPYDTTHLGHAFSYVNFDLLIRVLRALGHEVRYTQNVTDIDDDILRRAKELGIPWDELGREQTAQFQRDMARLNVLPPTHFPRATEEIPTMVEIIERLVASGHAYRVQGNVYFSVASDPTFGQLARLSPDEMADRFEETGDSPADPKKRDRLDFVLWKASAPGEPYWPSPWGNGRPGWHIECTAMATRYLGPRIDIHGGGDDLIFPHHSCEIAQSEAATGQAPFVRIWMHNGAVRLDGVKMSKSLGNLVMVRELTKRFSSDAIRLCLFKHHYRQSWDFKESELDDAVHLADAFARRAGDEAPQAGDAVTTNAVRVARRRVIAALADDLDAPTAVYALSTLLDIPGAEATETLRELGGILGLQLGY